MPAFNALTVPVLKPVVFAFSITFCALSTQTGYSSACAPYRLRASELALACVVSRSKSKSEK
jgi:hypothetical protein